MKKSYVEQFVEDSKNMRLFQQERAIYEVTGQIEDLMKEVGVTRSQLARRLGKSKGWITQLLEGDANKTIRTVADVLAVLGHEFHSFHRPIQVSNKIPRTPSMTMTFASPGAPCDILPIWFTPRISTSSQSPVNAVTTKNG